jgi:Uma2 family endonuclease
VERMIPTRHRISADEFLAGGPMYDNHELWDGAAVACEPAGGTSGEIEGRVLIALRTHVDSRKLGWAPSPSTGYWVAKAPDRVLAPDASFVSYSRLPKLPRVHFWECTPEFVVEVRSPTDRWSRTLAKCGVWIAHGALTAWAVDPHSRKVVAFRGLEAPTEHGPGETVDAAPALPDFRMSVDDLFAGLD